MDFKDYLFEQSKKHPSMQTSDVVKMCYQAAFGAEHLLMDVSAARRYFDAEFDSVEARDGELFECISDDVCRVDLGVWKKRELPREKLFDAFVATASVRGGGKELFLKYLSEAEACASEKMFDFSIEEWREFFERYKALGMPAIHHSEQYREKERPSYRIVRREFLENV